VEARVTQIFSDESSDDPPPRACGSRLPARV